MTLHLDSISRHRTDTTTDIDAGLEFEEGDFASVRELVTDDSDSGLEDDSEVPSGEFNKSGDMRAAATADLLADLMNNKAPAPGKAKIAGAGFDLDDLLAESLEEATASAAVKSGRKRLQDSRISKREKDEIEAKIREWELAREWKPAAAVHIFNTQTCTHCYSENSTYSGLFQRQIHRSSKIMRWVLDVNGSGSNDGLPKEHKSSSTEVTVCVECCAQQGFGALSPSI